MVELAVVPTSAIGGRQMEYGDVVVLCESPNRRPEPVADLLEQRRGGHRIAEVVAQEVRDLAFHLELVDVGVEVDASRQSSSKRM